MYSRTIKLTSSVLPQLTVSSSDYLPPAYIAIVMDLSAMLCRHLDTCLSVYTRANLSTNLGHVDQVPRPVSNAYSMFKVLSHPILKVYFNLQH